MTQSFITILEKYGLDEMMAKKFLYMLQGDNYLKLIDIIGDNDRYHSDRDFEKMEPDAPNLSRSALLSKTSSRPVHFMIIRQSANLTFV